MKPYPIKIVLLGMILSAVFWTALQPGFAQQGKSGEAAVKTETQAEPLPGLAELVHRAVRLDERSSNLQRQLPKVYNPEKTEKERAALTDRLEKLREKNLKLQATDNANYQDLAELKSSFQAVVRDTGDLIESVTDSIKRVEGWRAEWLGEFEKWTGWQEDILKSVKINTVASTFTRAQGIIARALKLISETLEPLLIAQEKTENLRYEIYKLTVEVDTLILTVRGDVLGKATPVMFSDHYMWNLRRSYLYELKRSLRISWPDQQFFIDEAWVIALEILLSLAIAISCKRNRRRLQETGKWNFVARRPYSAGLTVAIPILSAFHGPIPALWRLLLWLVAGTALSRLATGITANAWDRRMIYGLTALTIFNQLLLAVGLPVPFVRLYVLVVAVGGLLFFGWRLVRNILDKSGAVRSWLIRLAALVFLVVLIAEIIGQTVFAWSLLDASTRTILFLLMGWILIKLIRGGLELVARSPLIKKIPLLAKNVTAILRHTMTLITLVIWGFIIANILVDWRVYNIPSDAIQGVLSLGFVLGEQQVTLGLILSALAVLYGAFIVSWTIQGILMEDVFARRGLDRGARISIGRLIHYALVLVGFIFALFALGFDLKNVTILGGALGVGIGFGLQTIVNNFVCGLIMLFERPVKVGDSIELNGQNGKIKKVGLRSTVVQTYDNSEIVVPNSDLITNQVTNWTLAERLSRIKIPVGVAYGSDIQLVMKTLLQCAEDNQTVLKHPAPKALFLNFGGSSLDFELRVWVADFDSRLQVISELHQEIDHRFRELDIEIPFPQTDLHVRTIDQSAAAAFNGESGKPLSAVPVE
jgi:small-conductance mechanosensitive channel